MLKATSIAVTILDAQSLNISPLFVLVKRTRHLSKSFEIEVQPAESSAAQSISDLSKRLEILWCQRINHGEKTKDLWLEILKRPQTSTPTAGRHRLALNMVSLGAFTSPGRYLCHWKSQRTCDSRNDFLDLLDYDDGHDVECNTVQSSLMAGFEYDNDVITVSWTESAAVRWRMEISFDSLADRVVLVKRDGSVNHLYLFIVNQPKLYRGAPQQRRRLLDFDDDDNVEMIWERDVSFGSCDSHVIGSCNAIHLEFDSMEDDNIDGLLQRLSRHSFSIYVGSPETVESTAKTAIRWPRFEMFEATYAWYSLITRGFKVTDQTSDDIVDFLQEAEDEVLVAKLLYTIGDAFDNCCVVSLCLATLQREWDTLLQYRDVDDDTEDQQLEHLVKVRRLLLTPTAVRALTGEYMVGNRVVREFGVDLFVRVVLRDEDMELLSASACSLAKPVKAITDFMRRDLVIGDRRYHFLGCSNSQMHEHGFWMYASDGRHTVDSIRQWMGDLSHERCVATYVSRLGQFFSASKKTINVDEEFKRLVPDVERGGHCFTDGIGMISRSLTGKV